MAINPVIFTDGTEFYKNLGKKYLQHDKGLFILAPSGAGKTYFCTNQTEPHWIDGDELWLESNAQPPLEEEYWHQGVPIIEMVEQRSDVITAEAKQQGFWIMGSSCFWLAPDAVVVPDWDTLTAQIKQRQESNYDGGLTTESFPQLKKHLEIITDWHKKHGVPLYKSIPEAVSALTN